MQRSTFRLSRLFQTAVYSSFGLLVATGAGWMLAQTRPDDASVHEISTWLLKIHGAAAMFALLVLGALTAHVRRGWKAKTNRLTGAFIVALNLFLIASGYGLYYAGGEELRTWLSRWHGWIGLGVLLMLPAHIMVGRTIVRKKHNRKMLPAGGAGD
jgi:hypothetical protein